MAAYATQQREFSAREQSPSAGYLRCAYRSAATDARSLGARALDGRTAPALSESEIIGQLVDRIAQRLAAAIAERLVVTDDCDDEWLDSRHAADYLGVHRDTLRKLAAERAIPSEQDGPGCKLYFRRSDLDVWRRAGGRPRHLASMLAAVA
jgi:excisionase family DNA binding protein